MLSNIKSIAEICVVCSKALKDWEADGTICCECRYVPLHLEKLKRESAKSVRVT